MSIYSEYLDRITKGDLDARHGGDFAASFERFTKSVIEYERKLSAMESNINPLYEHYDGGSINGDYRYLETLISRSTNSPFSHGMNCKILTEAWNYLSKRADTQTIDVGSMVHYSYEYINTVPPFHDWYKDEYKWYIEITNNQDIQITPIINIYHPDGTLNVSLSKTIVEHEQNHRVCEISLHSYQSIPKVLFYFYLADHYDPYRIDIRPSDEITYYKYDSNIVS